jgi:hypothetical protein
VRGREGGKATTWWYRAPSAGALVPLATGDGSFRDWLQSVGLEAVKGQSR